VRGGLFWSAGVQGCLVRYRDPGVGGVGWGAGGSVGFLFGLELGFSGRGGLSGLLASRLNAAAW